MASTPDYTILHKPRISLGAFQRVLIAAGSPAAPYADRAYSGAVAYGVDPAVLLAIFRRESGYGRAGRATSTKSWGNLRISPNYGSRDGFVYYPSWAEGARDTARLLRVYGQNAIRAGVKTSTVQTLPYVWAPRADGNAPDKYGDGLAASIGQYIASDHRPRPRPTPAPRPATAPTHKARVNGTRIRRSPGLSGPIVVTVRAGATARVDRTVAGSVYHVDGKRSDRWVRIVARGGRRLASPVYSAALLWELV